MVHRNESQALDELLDALSNTRRRYALYYARGRDEADVDDMASTVTGWLAARSEGGKGSARELKQVRTSLHHSDLPKLSETGLVSFDRGDGTVEFEGSGVEEDLLDVLVEHERASDSAAADDSTYRGV